MHNHFILGWIGGWRQGHKLMRFALQSENPMDYWVSKFISQEKMPDLLNWNCGLIKIFTHCMLHLYTILSYKIIQLYFDFLIKKCLVSPSETAAYQSCIHRLHWVCTLFLPFLCEILYSNFDFLNKTCLVSSSESAALHNACQTVMDGSMYLQWTGLIMNQGRVTGAMWSCRPQKRYWLVLVPKW